MPAVVVPGVVVPGFAARGTVAPGAAVAKHVGNVFAKLGLTADETGHRRVRAVLA